MKNMEGVEYVVRLPHTPSGLTEHNTEQVLNVHGVGRGDAWRGTSSVGSTVDDSVVNGYNIYNITPIKQRVNAKDISLRQSTSTPSGGGNSIPVHRAVQGGGGFVYRYHNNVWYCSLWYCVSVVSVLC